MLDKSNMSTQVVLIHPAYWPAVWSLSCNTPSDSCGVYDGCPNIGWIMLKPTDTIDLMLEKINMSTQISFNASSASTDGAAA